MRMLDLDQDKPLKNLSLYLTPEEANQLLHDLQRLVSDPSVPT